MQAILIVACIVYLMFFELNKAIILVLILISGFGFQFTPNRNLPLKLIFLFLFILSTILFVVEMSNY